MREYHSPEPIILSVGEEDEVSIADVAKYVAGVLVRGIPVLSIPLICDAPIIASEPCVCGPSLDQRP